jgi:hypothetical protein
LDAEFVWVGPPQVQQAVTSEAALLSAVQQTPEKKQGRFSLARVSVVGDRGSDHDYDTVLDEYIASRERITDYLTRFSGIKPGDLDPSVSPHIVTTLKVCWLGLAVVLLVHADNVCCCCSLALTLTLIACIHQTSLFGRYRMYIYWPWPCQRFPHDQHHDASQSGWQ